MKLSFKNRFIGNSLASRRAVADKLKIAAMVIGLVMVYGIVGELDYQAELAIEAETQSIRAATAEKTLADCLNGKAQFVSADEKMAVVCSKAWEVSL